MKPTRILLTLTITSFLAFGLTSCGVNTLNQEEQENLIKNIKEKYQNTDEIAFPEKAHVFYGIKTTSAGFQPHKAPDETIYYEGVYDLKNNVQYLKTKNDETITKSWLYYKNGNLYSVNENGNDKKYHVDPVSEEELMINMKESFIYKTLTSMMSVKPFEYLEKFINEAKATNEENVKSWFGGFAKCKNKHSFISNGDGNLEFTSYVEITDGIEKNGRNYASRHECSANVDNYLLTYMDAHHWFSSSKGDSHNSILSDIKQYQNSDTSVKYPDLNKFTLVN